MLCDAAATQAGVAVGRAEQLTDLRELYRSRIAALPLAHGGEMIVDVSTPVSFVGQRSGGLPGWGSLSGSVDV